MSKVVDLNHTTNVSYSKCGALPTSSPIHPLDPSRSIYRSDPERVPRFSWSLVLLWRCRRTHCQSPRWCRVSIQVGASTKPKRPTLSTAGSSATSLSSVSPAIVKEFPAQDKAVVAMNRHELFRAEGMGYDVCHHIPTSYRRLAPSDRDALPSPSCSWEHMLLVRIYHSGSPGGQVLQAGCRDERSHI
ncbi:hypothetical protein JAAARDRAFT_474954 [Jaapia argillacea MUCL 33604]|uniref:Uncharacterized protein n=1 Tax=Jaapia argillacea MUCL 33604 TaxID=933084 RepID=A0A067PD61_9AGAM|nr:hypothetical protein JAAARDRAFT_474954 [Jaapia argillacea MUCL 33604]